MANLQLNGRYYSLEISGWPCLLPEAEGHILKYSILASNRLFVLGTDQNWKIFDAVKRFRQTVELFLRAWKPS